MRYSFALLLATALGLSAHSASAQGCNELFISKYLEGNGSNKAIELYNPTPNAITLNNTYVLRRYSNGNTSVSNELALVGTIASGQAFVITNGVKVDEVSGGTTYPKCAPELQALADMLDKPNYPSVLHFNGNDAITLEKKNGNTFDKIDIFGKIGEDPNDWGWSAKDPFDGTNGTFPVLTAQYLLVRKASVRKGITVNPIKFNTLAEWDTLPKIDNDFPQNEPNAWAKLGTHQSVCIATSRNEAIALEDLTVYPVPATNQLTVRLTDNTISQLSVLNQTGQQVLNAQPKATETTLSLAGLPSGLYLLNVTDSEQRTSTRKIIVQ